MENKEIDLVELFKAVRKQKKRIFYWGAIGLVAGVVIAISIPREYESKLGIVLENKASSQMSSAGALAGMMGLNVSGSSDGGVNEQLYPEVVKSTPFLSEFAQIPVVYENEQMPLWRYMFYYQKTTWWSHIFSLPSTILGLFSEKQPEPTALNTPQLVQAFAGTLKNRIKIETDAKTGIYTVSATMQDAQISQQLADSTMVQLGRYMTKYRTVKSEENLLTSIEMRNEAQQKYHQSDSLYAAAFDRNQNLVSQSVKIKIERLQNERNLAFSIYQQLATQVEMDRVKLKEDKPIATVIEPSIEPTAPSKPNKKLIIVGFMFLAMLGAAGVVVVKQLTQKESV